MNNALITFAKPDNEPVKSYKPGSPERIELQKELERQSNEIVEIGRGCDATRPQARHRSLP